MDYSNIIRVKDVGDAESVNRYLDVGWKIMDSYVRNQEMRYVLGWYSSYPDYPKPKEPEDPWYSAGDMDFTL